MSPLSLSGLASGLDTESIITQLMSIEQAPKTRMQQQDTQAANRQTQLRALSDASSALAEGELLQREDAYCSRVSVERYLERCALKTAALFEAACRLGALSAAER